MVRPGGQFMQAVAQLIDVVKGLPVELKNHVVDLQRPICRAGASWSTMITSAPRVSFKCSAMARSAVDLPEIHSQVALGAKHQKFGASPAQVHVLPKARQLESCREQAAQDHGQRTQHRKVFHRSSPRHHTTAKTFHRSEITFQATGFRDGRSKTSCETVRI